MNLNRLSLEEVKGLFIVVQELRRGKNKESIQPGKGTEGTTGTSVRGGEGETRETVPCSSFLFPPSSFLFDTLPLLFLTLSDSEL